ncbi:MULTISPECIES: DUF3883 domain-containing protein [unclassified Flavobacterium]|uniref:DUF3883 domain-containing protein n=1 Tax=unclassified Flavobacterium TaxID=196869 RepID=UPI000961D6B4|nr:MULTISPECIES: DUF3883 domain-containing protein [unclassified Flavobacterium]MBN9284850.1 DUF3883 domain-containing protein [Flavobacterium sp.]OJV71345.1 MAG: hypothetical protein BGO42_07980 [Flavobacterium sp. 40-81]
MEILENDLILINNLYQRRYSNNSLLTNASHEERIRLLDIRRKLKSLADFFAHKYENDYGPFETEMSTGNPVGQSTNLNNVWAGLFKGNSNKQYAAQISFVINRFDSCLDVGFYFGRASSRNLSNQERINLENQFAVLGQNLSNSLEKNLTLQNRFNEIFDFGFKSFLNSNPTTPFEWRSGICINPRASQITIQVYPKNGIIDLDEVDFLIAQIIFLMGYVTITATSQTKLPPFSTDQYLKRAERLAEIGLKGEIFILQKERIKLNRLGFLSNDYPKHVALESNIYGFDILSKDDNGEDIFIEVKTTTRNFEDSHSRQFFITSNEYETHERNHGKYIIARVYDINNDPIVEYLDLRKLRKVTDGFIVHY